MNIIYKNKNKKKNNCYHVCLNILFHNEIETKTPTVNLIVQLLDVTFEDVIDNVIYEIKKEIHVEDIQNNKLEFTFDVEILDLERVYSYFILIDVDKNNKISIGDYISTERHLFEPQDNNVVSLSIKVERVYS
ncbi:MAG: hypothetical protein K0S93_111 [Nitrososphaeraceae archaeon]|jgi:hypothetical protein|nr:hypothetical protein [Nitrososphaeraceae archaeon]